MSGLGPSFMTIWTCGSSPRSGSRNAWTRIMNVKRCQSSEQLLEFFRRDSNDFLSGAISDHGRNLVISLWPGYKATNNGVAAYWFTPPRNIPSPKIRLDFLASRRHHPHWLSSKGPNYQRGVLLISSGLIEGHFEVKAPREVHEGGLVLSRQFPGSPGTCNPEETGLTGLPLSRSPTLFFRSVPVDLPPVS